MFSQEKVNLWGLSSCFFSNNLSQNFKKGKPQNCTKMSKKTLYKTLLSCENKQKICNYLGIQSSLWSSVIFGNRLAQYNYPLCLELTEPCSAIFLSEGFILCCISECSQTPTHQQRALSPNLGAAPWKPKGVLPSTLMKVGTSPLFAT